MPTISLLGELPSPLVGLRNGVALDPPQPPELAKWAEAAEQNNLGVQQQRLAVEIASREVERQRAGHLPLLDLVASTGHNPTLRSGDREIIDANRIGLQLNVPIFLGGEVSSKTAEADAKRRAALGAQETARR